MTTTSEVLLKGVIRIHLYFKSYTNLKNSTRFKIIVSELANKLEDIAANLASIRRVAIQPKTTE